MYYTVHLQYFVFEHDKILLTKRLSRYFTIYPVAGLNPVLTGTSSASAMNAFNDFSFFEFRFRDSADAHRAEVRVSGLDATKATQVLVTLKKINSANLNFSFSKITLTLLKNYFNFDLQHSQVSETANF